MEGHFCMSKKELNKVQTRLQIIQGIENKELEASEASKLLNISIRQLNRLRKAFKEEGANGLISKKIGSTGNHRVPEKEEKIVLRFFRDKDHQDFGPTLAHEYMSQSWDLQASVSTVRSIMIRYKLWIPNIKMRKKIHPLRPPRPKYGELVQLDGSKHAWFEKRGPECTLLVYVDDATSAILHAKFVCSENRRDYLIATREYIELHGIPEFFYTDKHSVFKTTRTSLLNENQMTQFNRVLVEMGIKLICAHSPQAKGRVERRNRDLQNRLIKALRIAKINTIEAGNAYIPTFLKEFNAKFARAPKSPLNAHRPISNIYNLDKIFCLKNKRVLSKNLTMQYEGILYQVYPEGKGNSLRGAKVDVLESLKGEITFEKDGKRLKAVPYGEIEVVAEEVEAKDLDQVIERALNPKKKYIPPFKSPLEERLSI